MADGRASNGSKNQLDADVLSSSGLCWIQHAARHGEMIIALTAGPSCRMSIAASDEDSAPSAPRTAAVPHGDRGLAQASPSRSSSNRSPRARAMPPANSCCSLLASSATADRRYLVASVRAEPRSRKPCRSRSPPLPPTVRRPAANTWSVVRPHGRHLHVHDARDALEGPPEFDLCPNSVDDLTVTHRHRDVESIVVDSLPEPRSAPTLNHSVAQAKLLSSGAGQSPSSSAPQQHY